MQIFVVKFHKISHQLSQICRRFWRNKITSLEDYHASLCILREKELVQEYTSLFLCSTVVSAHATLHCHVHVIDNKPVHSPLLSCAHAQGLKQSFCLSSRKSPDGHI